MYASIRRYHVDDVDEVLWRVNEGYIPIVAASPGFVSYSVVDVGEGELISISIFESQDDADEATRRGLAWVRENLADLVDTPTITHGSVPIYETS